MFSVCLLSVLIFGSPCSQGKTQPNILILYADDIGYGDLSSYNTKSKIPTPHLDRLAAEGMRFTDGHSSSGICSPSRYALLTGRYHWRRMHGIVKAFEPSVFSSERMTLQQMLKDNGYTTSMIGKWHLGWDWDSIRKKGAKPQRRNKNREIWGPEAFDWSKPFRGGPVDHGFDYYFGDGVINFPPYTWIENDRVLKAPDTMVTSKAFKPIKEGQWEMKPGPMVTGWDPYENIPLTTAKGVEKIRAYAKDKKPFFMYFAFPSPHAPIIPNDEFDGSSKAGPYGDFVVETDAACGKLLEALKEAGIEENTIVIFTADNGPERYAYERDEKYDHWSSYPLRGLKRDIYEGGHRIPFIVKWPGLTKAGSVSDALVSQIDLMITLAEALKIDLPSNQAEDSHNLLPILGGETSTARTTLVHNTYKGKYAIRRGNWLLINTKSGYEKKDIHRSWEKKHEYPEDNAQPRELYDLTKDFGQRNNVAELHPEVVDELKKELESIRSGSGTAPRLGL